MMTVTSATLQERARNSLRRHAAEEIIGGTPLARIRNLPCDDRMTLWAKCEFMNPTGSVKDRAGICYD